MPCGQAPSPQQRAGEAASESHVTADAISQQGGDNYALRASSIQPASSLRGSTPAQSQHRLCHLLELISRAPFGFWEIPTAVRGGPLGPMGPRKSFGAAALLYKHCLSVFFWPLRPFSLSCEGTAQIIQHLSLQTT